MTGLPYVTSSVLTRHVFLGGVVETVVDSDTSKREPVPWDGERGRLRYSGTGTQLLDGKTPAIARIAMKNVFTTMALAGGSQCVSACA